MATAPMLDELATVLRRPGLERWQPHLEPALTFALEHAEVVDAPSAVAPPGLQCSDRADQKFIDLALALPAAWLLSRDKAVLRLARRARGLGVAVLRPDAWQAP